MTAQLEGIGMTSRRTRMRLGLLPPDGVLLDGEVTAMTADGRTDFSALQAALSAGGSPSPVSTRETCLGYGITEGRSAKNDTWLRQQAWPLISGACEFLASFVVPDPTTGNFTMLHVLPTTEVGFVKAPAYSTAATALSLWARCESRAA